MEGPAAAIGPVREAMEIFAALGDSWAVAEGLEAVAAVRAEDVPAVAVTLAAAADRIRRDIGMRAHPPDARVVARRLESVRELLTAEDMARSRRAGESLTVDAAAAMGLQSA